MVSWIPNFVSLCRVIIYEWCNDCFHRLSPVMINQQHSLPFIAHRYTVSWYIGSASFLSNTVTAQNVFTASPTHPNPPHGACLKEKTAPKAGVNITNVFPIVRSPIVVFFPPLTGRMSSVLVFMTRKKDTRSFNACVVYALSFNQCHSPSRVRKTNSTQINAIARSLLFFFC